MVADWARYELLLQRMGIGIGLGLAGVVFTETLSLSAELAHLEALDVLGSLMGVRDVLGM